MAGLQNSDRKFRNISSGFFFPIWRPESGSTTGKGATTSKRRYITSYTQHLSGISMSIIRFHGHRNGGHYFSYTDMSGVAGNETKGKRKQIRRRAKIEKIHRL